MSSSYFEFIFAVYNLANNITKEIKFLVVYSTNGHLLCLNDWQDEYYLLEYFQHLFRLEIVGILQNKRLLYHHKSGQNRL